jgi:hypothetical protein
VIAALLLVASAPAFDPVVSGDNAACRASRYP